MIRAFTIFLISLSPLFATELIPLASVRDQEGAKFPELRFKNGTDEMSYQPPNGWRYYRGGQALCLTPPDKVQATGKIAIGSPTMSAGPVDEAAMKALQKQAEAMLPQGSDNISLVSEAQNAVVLNGHDTYEATFAYSFYGQRFEYFVLFSNLGKEQMTAEFSSHEADFTDLQRAFHGSLFSWQWLKH